MGVIFPIELAITIIVLVEEKDINLVIIIEYDLTSVKMMRWVSLVFLKINQCSIIGDEDGM